MDAQVQIMQVAVRNTRTGKTVYDVSCSDGKKRQVWDAALANQLHALTGQTVTIRYDQKQNGQYLNESIQAFAPPGQQLPPDMNAQAAPMMAPPTTTTMPMGGGNGPIPQAAPSGGSGSRWTPETTTRITKLACIEYASTLVAGLFAGSGPEAVEEAVTAVENIAKRFYASARAHENAPQGDSQAPIVPTATTPQEVAQQLPAGAVQVGAPVAVQQDAAAEAPDVIQWD